MIVAAALAGVILFIAAGLTWTARLVHRGNLDMLALAEKTAAPEPASVLDWPELRLRAVVPQPGGQQLVLLHVGWPKLRRRQSLERVHAIMVAEDSPGTRW